MARTKSDNVQINISIPAGQKTELENPARIYSAVEGESIGASINLVPVKQIKYLKKELKNIRKNTSLKHENRGVKHVRK